MGMNVHHGLQESFLTGYRTDMLRFIRANYEIFLDHFRSQRVQNLLIRKYMGNDLQVLQTEWKSGVYGINEQLFEIVQSFTNVLNVLVQSIPIGLNSEED